MIFTEKDFMREKEKNHIMFYSNLSLFPYMNPTTNFYKHEVSVPIETEKLRIIYDEKMSDKEINEVIEIEKIKKMVEGIMEDLGL